MASNHHDTSLVNDSIVRISGYIIKELEKGSVGVFGGRRLLLAELVDTYKEFYQQLERNIGGHQQWIGHGRCLCRRGKDWKGVPWRIEFWRHNGWVCACRGKADASWGQGDST